MLRPERMVRAIIAGPRNKLPAVIESLHKMQVLHIVDHHGEDETFHIGKPLPQAGALSEYLVKLRSVASILGVETAPKGAESVKVEDLSGKVVSLELSITEEDAARKKAEALLGDIDRRIEELRPFAALGLPLERYRGYDTIAVFVGRAQKEPIGLDTSLPKAEVFEAPGVLAVFVPKDLSDQAQSVVSGFGFTQLDIPAGEGSPKALLDTTVADREKWKGRLEEIQGRLDKLREKYAAFVVAAEEALEVEVEKAEAPLRIAVSDHSFVVDGWIPAAKAEGVVSAIRALGVHAEAGETGTAHSEEQPPTLLKNPKPAKPFEMLVQLYSTPSYHELDPTLFLLVAFPIFFGFMIGDAGYGALFFAFGMIALFKLPKDSDFRKLLLIIAVGGFWALVFGLFVFGEMFGMAFHLPALAPPDELSWAQFGLNFPIEEPLLHKSLDIGDMFYVSILFGALHLGTSYVIGFINEIRHSKKHAVAKVGWFLCLFGLFSLLTAILSWTRTGGWVWNVALSWFPRQIEPLGLSGVLHLGIGIPFASLLLIMGALLGFLETPIAPLEIGGQLANLLSYLRLAGIGIGKATIASTFNILILHGLVLDHDIPIAIVGLILLVFAHMLVFLLGAVSAAIQGVRLNYVESFTKFYKGNGTLFQPFGMRRTQEA